MTAWEEAIEQWRTALTASGYPASTIRLRTGWVRRMGRWVGVGPWEVEEDHLTAWGGTHEWARNTRRAAYASVSKFYGWAERAGYVDDSPAAALPAIRQAGPRPHPCPEDVIRQALAQADEETALMIRLASEAGLRRGEVARVHAHDLIDDLMGRSLIVHGKGGKERTIPLSDDLAGEIDARCRANGGWAFPARFGDGHMTPGAIGDRVSEALEGDWSMHSLRHRFASRAYGLTGDVLAVQAILGHASPTTTLAYVVVEPDRLRRAVMAVAA
ncbi:tyrosine-type recombinase/integrase [Actinomyces faecalis]|uniref:tyrosine-type recombinase/integrase n=1 Tax=Actinomyces faecalis TaxID=2722820 RepID=UPI0015582C8D|nr:tyrosine-type recombinase/integrase [Actinomyces faecalis]